MDLLIYNVYSLSNNNTIRDVNNFVYWHNLSIMALLKTKINRDRVQKQSLKFGFSNCFCIETVGRVVGT